MEKMQTSISLCSTCLFNFVCSSARHLSGGHVCWGSQLSFGPISWLIVGEVFGLGVRGQATAVASLINFGSNFGVSFALPTVQKSLGQDGTYLLFCVISIVAVASIYFTVPETKGKSLEEIETMFDEGRME
mmetsp:Transcript_9185/g.27579  ORF Transcript_9185/g.27579 Transcript_9185/m.27579 type:complete len:131 (-) Transcript_9185:496-888(-)